MTKFNCFLTFTLVTMIMFSCNKANSQKQEKKSNKDYTYHKLSPNFNSDSAYTYIDKQISFGYRVPNTKEHIQCGDYLVEQLQTFGAKVYEQKFNAKAYNGDNLHARNIIGSYNPELKERILLFSHWDTRPYADMEKDATKQYIPIPGANDGASGVGVLLEIARQLGVKTPNIGVDIIFFDVEDYGPPSFIKGNVPEGDWWCLGTQYWGNNPHIENYTAKFGILLDMVGAPNATFYKEGYSLKYAENILESIWSTARQLGYKEYFISNTAGGIIDDHLYVNQLRGIPSIDIIDLNKENYFSFKEYWHTHNDNMNNINKETLQAVGQTILEVIYKNEQK